MNNLLESKRQFIFQKKQEYSELEKKLNKRKNEFSLLNQEKQVKFSEYETAKEELDKINIEIQHDKKYLADMMEKYIYKRIIKYIFSLLGKATVIFAGINLLLTFLGVIKILSISDFVSYFFCAPGFLSCCALMVASLFSNKKKKQFNNDFHNLDESIKLHEIIEKKIEESKQKELELEEKNVAFRDCKNRVNQLEYKISSLNYEMDKIKTAVFETIYSSDDIVYIPDQSLRMKF